MPMTPFNTLTKAEDRIAEFKQKLGFSERLTASELVTSAENRLAACREKFNSIKNLPLFVTRGSLVDGSNAIEQLRLLRRLLYFLKDQMAEEKGQTKEEVDKLVVLREEVSELEYQYSKKIQHIESTFPNYQFVGLTLIASISIGLLAIGFATASIPLLSIATTLLLASLGRVASLSLKIQLSDIVPAKVSVFFKALCSDTESTSAGGESMPNGPIKSPSIRRI